MSRAAATDGKDSMTTAVPGINILFIEVQLMIIPYPRGPLYL